MIKIFPSLISANLLHLADVIEKLESHCDGFHLDVMDDQFVPNLTWGAMFINAIAKKTNKMLFVHLMVEKPESWLSRLHINDESTLAFHIENKVDHKKLIKRIKEKKWKTCIGIKPKTPLEEIFNFAHLLDQVLLLSVEPGFSGQHFLKGSLDRLNELVAYRKKNDLNFEIVMDGGINKENIKKISDAGADQAGIAAAIFADGSPIENLKNLKAIDLL